jgi:hypothetical protein
MAPTVVHSAFSDALPEGGESVCARVVCSYPYHKGVGKPAVHVITASLYGGSFLYVRGKSAKAPAKGP